MDVTVEVSEDGTRWRRVGEVKGITADADFMPVEFEPVTVKKVRLTATAEPYHEDYTPGMADLSKTTFDYPHFVWRLLAPVENAGPKKNPDGQC